MTLDKNHDVQVAEENKKEKNIEILVVSDEDEDDDEIVNLRLRRESQKRRCRFVHERCATDMDFHTHAKETFHIISPP